MSINLSQLVTLDKVISTRLNCLIRQIEFDLLDKMYVVNSSDDLLDLKVKASSIDVSYNKMLKNLSSLSERSVNDVESSLADFPVNKLYKQKFTKASDLLTSLQAA